MGLRRLYIAAAATAVASFAFFSSAIDRLNKDGLALSKVEITSALPGEKKAPLFVRINHEANGDAESPSSVMELRKMGWVCGIPTRTGLVPLQGMEKDPLFKELADSYHLALRLPGFAQEDVEAGICSTENADNRLGRYVTRIKTSYVFGPKDRYKAALSAFHENKHHRRPLPTNRELRLAGNQAMNVIDSEAMAEAGTLAAAKLAQWEGDASFWNQISASLPPLFLYSFDKLLSLYEVKELAAYARKQTLPPLVMQQIYLQMAVTRDTSGYDKTLKEILTANTAPPGLDLDDVFIVRMTGGKNSYWKPQQGPDAGIAAYLQKHTVAGYPGTGDYEAFRELLKGPTPYQMEILQLVRLLDSAGVHTPPTQTLNQLAASGELSHAFVTQGLSEIAGRVGKVLAAQKNLSIEQKTLAVQKLKWLGEYRNYLTSYQRPWAAHLVSQPQPTLH